MLTEPVTFTEQIKGGLSTIVCNVCGDLVSAENKHIRIKHAGPDVSDEGPETTPAQ